MTKLKQVKYFEEMLQYIVKSKNQERDIRLASISLIKIVDKESEISREIMEAIIYACIDAGDLSIRSIKTYLDIHISELRKAFLYVKGAEKACIRLNDQSNIFNINRQFVSLKDSMHFIY